MNSRSPLALASCAVIAAVTVSSHAQDYPARPLRWIVPVPAGSTGDIVTRIVAAKMGERFGQQVIVDNRPGGAMVIASTLVARAAADGYTLGTLLTPHIVHPFVLKDLPYDTQRDFAPVSLMVIAPNVLTIHPGVPAAGLKELLALARSRPGGLNYGTPGPLTSGHLTIEMLKLAAGVQMTFVPYKGGAPAITDLIAGQIQLLVSGTPGVLPHIRAGRLRAIGATTAQRLPGLPDVPTFAEQGLAGFETYGWYGAFAPAAVPRTVLARLSGEVARAIRLPEFTESLAAQGVIPVGGTPAELAAFVTREISIWGKIARKVNLRPD